MMKSDNFYRRGFAEVRGDVEAKMGEQFKSEVVDELRTNDFVIERDGVKVYLAKVCTKQLEREVAQASVVLPRVMRTLFRRYDFAHPSYRISAFVGEWNDRLRWRTKLLIIFQIAKCILQTN